MERYLKPSEVAQLLGITRQTVYKWITEKKLAVVRFSPRCIRIPESELRTFVGKNTKESIQWSSVRYLGK